MKKLLVMIAALALLTACGSGGSKQKNEEKTTTTTTMTTTMTHQHFKVSGLCNMCKERIEKTVQSIEGVTSAKWDSDAQQVHVDFDNSKTTVDAISSALAKAGHDTELFKADQATYDALPKCCKYRK